MNLIIGSFPLYLLLSLSIFDLDQALAIPARTVYAQDVQGTESNGVELKVWKGYGVTINFIPTGETIKQVWIGDPTRIGFTSNGDLCQKTDSNTECANTGATVLFLRQIKPVSFPNMTNSKDGSTQITVITSGDGGQKQYQFKLTPATGQPAYTSLIIKPDSEKPLITARTQPAAQKPDTQQQRANPINSQNQPTAPTTTRPLLSTKRQGAGGGGQGEMTPDSCRGAQRNMFLRPPLLTSGSRSGGVVTERSRSVESPPELSPLLPASCSPASFSTGSIQRNDANAVVAGLAVANRNGQIKSGSTTWNKVQDAIRLLRQGKSKQEAVSRSGISQAVFNQLIEWGRRP